MSHVALCAAVALDHGSPAPPEWVHLLPAGIAKTNDGRGPYRVVDPAQLMARSLAAAGGKMVLCENHATDLAAPKGLPAPAAGWIVELQNRADGIWGRVEWVNPAAGAWRAYRGISPAIAHDKDGIVVGILRASLTNTPNITGLHTLHSQETTMGPLALRAQLIDLLALSVPADAPEIDTAIVNKIKLLLGHKDVQEVSTHSAARRGQELALQASAYQRKLAASGITIEFNAAVRAVEKEAADAAPGTDMRSRIIRMLGLMSSADDSRILAKIAELVKRQTGRDVALMSTGGHARQLALQATTYQSQLAASGISIDYSTAVRAVADGKAI